MSEEHIRNKESRARFQYYLSQTHEGYWAEPAKIESSVVLHPTRGWLFGDAAKEFLNG